MSNISRLTTLAAAGAGVETEQYVALLVSGSGFTNGTHTTAVFPWSKSEGFGTQLNSSTSIYPNRAASTTAQIAFSPDKGALAAAHFDNPDATVVAWDEGYGSKYADPSTAIGGGAAEGLAFHPNGDYLAVGGNSTPWLQVYNWSDSSGWGSRRSNSWNPNSTVDNIAWHPDGGWLVAVAQASQKWNAVKWTGSSLTTRYEPPGSGAWPRSTAYRTAFNTAGTYVAVGAANTTADSPYRLNILAFNAASSGNPFGSTVTVNLPNSVGTVVYDVKWTPDDNAIVIATNVPPYIHAYAWSNSTGLGSKFSNASTAVQSTPTNITFNTDGDVLFVSHIGSEMLNAYEFSSSTGFGSKYTSPTLSGYSSLSDGSGLAYLDFG